MVECFNNTFINTFIIINIIIIIIPYYLYSLTSTITIIITS